MGGALRKDQLPAFRPQPIYGPMRRLTFLLAAFALLFAPLAMIGGGAATAHAPAASSAMDHCAGMDGSSSDQPAMGIDCLIACAAIPALPPRIEGRMVAPAPVAVPAPIVAGTGLDPEAETPPPRVS